MYGNRQPLAIAMSESEDKEGAKAPEVPPSPPDQQQEDDDGHEKEGETPEKVSKKKQALTDQIQELKAKREALQKERKVVATQVKAAQRKRRRLKKKALNLSSLDLFELCRMKSLTPDSMEEEARQATAAAASSAGDGAALNCELLAPLL